MAAARSGKPDKREEKKVKPDFVLRNCWYVAGLAADFPTESLHGQVIAKQPIVLWRTREGAVVAFDDRCAHKRFPLSKGRLMPDGTLECAYHGLRYNPEGRCVAVPSQPDQPIPRQACVKAYPVIERDGLVWVWPGDPDQASRRAPPSLPEVGADDYDTVVVGPMQAPANYLLLIENLLDITHFYPLHDGNIGDEANSRLPVEIEEGEVDGNRYVMSIRKATNYEQPPYLVDWFHYERVDRHHTHCMMSPAITRVVMRNAPPGELPARSAGREFPGSLERAGKERGYVLVHTHTPVDETNHVWRVIVNAPKDHMAKGAPEITTARRVAEMFPKVAAEDLWALERQQGMFAYPDDDYHEVFLKADLPIRRARQIFRDMARAESEAGGSVRPAQAAE